MPINKTKTLYIVYPHGFCAGVSRAINTLEIALEKFGPPIYVNHQIVHNTFLVKYFKKKGVKFNIPLNKIPQKSICVFSAHGVSPSFREKCQRKNFKIIDASCPLVLKVHTEAAIFAKKNYEIFFIGQKNHQEVKGTAGIAKIRLIENEKDIAAIRQQNFTNKKVVCLTQTTLSTNDTQILISKLTQKIPHLLTTKDICYASTNRQNAVKILAKKCDFIAVIGSKNSSNSNRLVETARSLGVKAGLFDNYLSIPKKIFQYEKIGLTSGASVPEILFEKVIKNFKQKNPQIKTKLLKTIKETVSFQLPDEVNTSLPSS